MAATGCCGVAVVREPRGGVAGCDVAQAASASTTITSAQWRAAESRIAGNPAGSTDTSINVALAAGESAPVAALPGDRKRVGLGKRWSVRVDLGGRRKLNKKNKIQNKQS